MINFEQLEARLAASAEAEIEKSNLLRNAGAEMIDCIPSEFRPVFRRLHDEVFKFIRTLIDQKKVASELAVGLGEAGNTLTGTIKSSH